MADINNIDEYRASVLSALGIEDDVNIRYFADFRKALFEGLGMEFTVEELRNEERFRIKILDAVVNTEKVIDNLLAGDKYIEKTVSGDMATFTDGAYNLPLKSLILDINPKQDGEGIPSLSNIRQIIKQNSVKVFRSGDDPTNIKTFDIMFDSEIFGGTLDIAKGKQINDQCYFQPYGEESSISDLGTYWGWVGDVLQTPFAVGNGSNDGVCSHFEYGVDTLTGVDASSGRYFLISKTALPNISTLAEFKSWVVNQRENGTPLTVCYKKVEQITENDITPVKIKTMLGKNNFWTGCGKVTVTYLADTTIS